MRIIDTHLHLIYLDKFSYPWLSNFPALNHQSPVEAYFAEAEKLGIEGALHMEVDVADDDIVGETAFVTQLHPKVVGAIAGARPEWESFPEQVAQLAAIKGTKALRRVLHTMPDELSQTPLFAENVRLLAAHKLSFDLCVRADQLPIATALATKAPDVQFVLDHCGGPKVGAKEFDPWRDYIKSIAALPNVAAKVSGLVAYTDSSWTVDDLRPFVEHIIESFGWDRVVWGSDHPVCTLTANLTSWVEATHKLIAGASEDEKAKLLHRNAERIYRI